ncbi:aliphatic sulfonate ABC transporter substrate-binding protein [Streptomyces sp. SL13]|uniref:Aliphatic sulfonate ABC transporter substrate-binding protein n=1 Tax=Streptantibioticus silvisoli TaxID=2705255 RepID=A0AA90H743_9ACTN|nr:aliphatic sulfonate ABC transporter substrate-binding protein [Streptantibioticus silvisoli]MDI5964203.1 aliphatic sulfonate ABC transporter substrate-binding protein [Streptantibioticus silvisoli]MDI5971732.1 aliphatic sulfonate ABC transporter substrate-binding protein [Streptantibioticus silvisoli]
MIRVSPARRSARRTRVLAAVAVLPLLAGALAACSYGSKSTASHTAAPAPAASGKKLSASTVRIGYFANVTHATALVGLQKGLFQKQLGATKIDTQVFNAGPSEVEALNAGAIDIGWIGPSPAINAYVKSHSQDLRIISGSASGGVDLVVNPKKVHSLKDLRGKRIATPQLGNTQDVALLNYLASQGYKEDAQSGKGDVTVERIDNKTTPVVFRQGGIDGAWVPEPTASQLVAEGGKVLLNEKSLWPKGQFVITNIVVSQKFLAAHPDVVEAVLRGSVDTNAWIKANPAGAKQAINQQLTALSGKPLPTSVLDSAFANVEVTDDPLASTLQAEADHAVKAGLLQQPDLKGIYDLGPLNKVLAAEGRPAVSDAGL